MKIVLMMCFVQCVSQSMSFAMVLKLHEDSVDDVLCTMCESIHEFCDGFEVA